MKINWSLVISGIMLLSSCAYGQKSKDIMTITEELPYAEIGDYPESISELSILTRLIDGLGYRYYWATDSLRQEDLDYKISEDSRPAGETLDHLYGLSDFILNFAMDRPNIRPREEVEMSWEEKRKATLENFKKSSELIGAMTKEDFAALEIHFQRGENTSSMSMWHIINGPISDALYHVGQIVTYRRASGNPLNPRVNVFMGKNRS